MLNWFLLFFFFSQSDVKGIWNDVVNQKSEQKENVPPSPVLSNSSVDAEKVLLVLLGHNNFFFL